MTRSLRSGALVLFAVCAAPVLPFQVAAAQQQCNCPPGVGGGPTNPTTPGESTPPSGSEEERRRSRKIPLLAPLGLLGLLTGAASQIPPGAPVGGTVPPGGISASSAPSFSVAAAPAPVPAEDVQRMRLAFRGKTDSLARGMRAPDTATLLPTLMALGATLVAAGVALMRRPRA